MSRSFRFAMVLPLLAPLAPACAAGDTMKGTATTDRDGKEQKQEFEAKRQKIKD